MKPILDSGCSMLDEDHYGISENPVSSIEHRLRIELNAHR
jgi:hypothetical protein